MRGWDETYEGLYEGFCWRYHPAVAAILAHEFLASREASLRAWDTYRRNQLPERKAS
jgi:hypothetical protein